MNYVNNLQEFRENLNVSRSELAKLTGLSTSGIYRIETGSREPKISNALAISKALKIPIDHLFPSTKQHSE